MNTNRDRLVKLSVVGEVMSPTFGRSPYVITPDGEPVVLPSLGGITYNVRVGDLACGWEADHVEPGVTIQNHEKPEGAWSANNALNIFACVGNEARVVSGDAKGERGVVTGKHGGIEDVHVDFAPEVMDRLIPGDKILVKAFGVGQKLLDFPQVKIMNIDPGLLDKLGIGSENGKLVVPVTHTIPAAIMGSGLGSDQTYRGDYDITMFDHVTVEKYGLGDIRFGDFVAIEDADNSFGRIYRTGAVTVGIVVHSNCVIAGHGPGVTTIFTSSTGQITPRIDPKANLADILGLRG